MRPNKIDENFLIRLYTQDLFSTVKCAEILGVSESCIRRRLKKLQISIRSGAEQNTHKDIGVDEIINAYCNEKLSIDQCAKKFNKSGNLIKNRLKQAGIQIRSVSDGIKTFHNTDNITDEEIIDLYENKKMSTYEISKHFNKSPAFARQRMLAIGHARRKNIGEFNGSWKGNIDEDINLFEQIKNDYMRGKTFEYIKEKYKISYQRLKKSFENASIPIRSKQEVVQLVHGKIPVEKHQEICNRYINNKTESCVDIAKDYLVTPETIGNILRYNGIKPENFGQRLSHWKGGITPLHISIRTGSRYEKWRDDIFKRDSYKSCISGIKDTLNCHHLFPFAKLLQTSIKKNMILLNNSELYKYIISNDERFYDQNNGISLLEQEHKLLETFNPNGHPWWRIWKVFPEYALNKSILTENDMLLFDSDGKIDALKSILYKGQISEVKNIIRYEHYLGTVPSSSTVLVSKIGNIITGIATFGRGANKNLEADTLELTRLCVPYYVIRPYGSIFLMMCNSYIKEHFREIKRLVAYADPSVGHNGGVYRMAKWNKNGKTEPSYCYLDPLVFELKHKSYCRRIKGIDKTEKQLAEERGLIKIALPPKYRYIYPLY